MSDICTQSETEPKSPGHLNYCEPGCSTSSDSRNWAKLAAVYTAEADLLDGFAGKPAAVHGSAAAADRFKSSGLTNIASKVVSVAAEGEKIAHVGYQLEYDGGYSRAQITVYDTADGWKIDEQVLPLESPRTYAALVPKRDNFGHVWMVSRATAPATSRRPARPRLSACNWRGQVLDPKYTR